MIPLILIHAALLSSANSPRGGELGGEPEKRSSTAIDPSTALAPVARGIEKDDNGWYVQLGAGLVTTTNSEGPGEEIDFDEGYAIPVALGYRFGAEDANAVAFDLEFEALYTQQDASDQGTLQAVNDVTALSGFIDGVGDFALGRTFSFYGGAGIGVSALDVGTESDALNSFDEEDGPFLAWQGKAGFRWYATPTVSWNLGYRFVNIDDAEIDDDVGGASFDLETQQHIVELGLRFSL